MATLPFTREYYLKRICSQDGTSTPRAGDETNPYGPALGLGPSDAYCSEGEGWGMLPFNPVKEITPYWASCASAARAMISTGYGTRVNRRADIQRGDLVYCDFSGNGSSPYEHTETALSAPGGSYVQTMGFNTGTVARSWGGENVIHSRELWAIMDVIRPHYAAPAPTTAPRLLTVNGLLDVPTIEVMQHNAGTPVDGVITPDGSALVRWLQWFLNEHGYAGKDGKRLTIDGVGLLDNTVHDTDSTNTQYALIGFLGNRNNDGTLSHPSAAIESLQHRYNATGDWHKASR